jgi:hypothetical protein
MVCIVTCTEIIVQKYYSKSVRKPDDLETYLFVVVFHAGGAEFYICQ